MMNPNYPDCLDLYRGWSELLAAIVRHQSSAVDAQYQVGLAMLNALQGGAVGPGPRPDRETGVGAPGGAAEADRVLRLATECVGKGQPPPREVYDVRHRRHIDWSLFPEWARPSDPELFEGCAHEG